MKPSLIAAMLTPLLLFLPEPFHLEKSADAGQRICEQWRDYLYNVKTGAFIEWVGEPYFKCYDEGDPFPKGHPNRPPRGKYDGGNGIPVGIESLIKECNLCQSEATARQASAQATLSLCRDDQKRFAEGMCLVGQHNNSPTTPPIPQWLTDKDQYICKDMDYCQGDIYDPIFPRGMPCFHGNLCLPNPNYGKNKLNPVFESCVNGWLDGAPGTSTTTSSGGTTGTVGAGPIDVTFPTSDGHSETIVVPPGTGLNSVCRANYTATYASINQELGACKAKVTAKAKRAKVNYGCY